jgi:hypothetical protein
MGRRLTSVEQRFCNSTHGVRSRFVSYQEVPIYWAFLRDRNRMTLPFPSRVRQLGSKMVAACSRAVRFRIAQRKTAAMSRWVGCVVIRIPSTPDDMKGWITDPDEAGPD